MLDFYWLEFTTKDQPGLFWVVLYTNWCNFRCYGCHNRTLAGWDYKTWPTNKWSPQIIQIDPDKYHKKLNLEEVELALKNDFLDIVILCGWEFLIHNIEKIEKTINRIKQINPNLKIRIDTNWSFPEKIKYLKEKNLVDWFAMDIKGPYWNQKYYSQLSQVIWLPEQILPKLTTKLLESIHLVDGMEYSLFRTVYYPIIQDKSYFEEIKNFTKQLKSPHSFNLFQDV